MKLYVLFGQRKENYPGQYAPEALECIDEWGMEDNGAWIGDKKREFEATGEFESLVIVPLEMDGAALMQRLRPPVPPALSTTMLESEEDAS